MFKKLWTRLLEEVNARLTVVEENVRALNKFSAEVGRLIEQHQTQVQKLQNQIQEIKDGLFSLSTHFQSLANEVQLLSKAIEEKNLAADRLKDIAADVAELKETIKTLKPYPISEVYEESVNFDKFFSTAPSDFYSGLEEVFRGKEASIKKKQRYYLRFIKPINDAPVLDLGCGRGEFLELLKERNVRCLGVDVTPKFVEIARKKGLNVKLVDAFEFLESTDKAFSAITAFQFVEHFPPNKVKKLIALSFKKLEKGGVLLVETPNPSNPYVFENFYTDDTHVRPYSSGYLAYLFYYTGFTDIKVIYSSPLPPSIRSHYLKANYLDFAVIGRKT